MSATASSNVITFVQVNPTYSASTNVGATETVSVGPTVFGKGALSIGGTQTVGDTINLSTQFPSLAGGVKTVTYTVQTGDILDTIAANVSTPINASSNLQAIGVTSTNSASANFINSENFTASPPVASGASLATASATDGGGTTNTNPYRTNTNGIPANQSLTFDLNGNMTSDGTNTYQWDAENRLIQINSYPGSGNNSVFTYDAFGHVVAINETASGSLNSTKLFVRGVTSMDESRNSTGALTSQFFAEGQANFSGTSTIYLYQLNHRGDVVGVSISNGNQVNATYFDPYGRAMLLSASFIPDFGFTHLYVHQISGLLLGEFRAYNPNISRWMNRDPIREQGGINLYDYVSNCPISLVDPSGLNYSYDDPGETPYIMQPAQGGQYTNNIWIGIGLGVSEIGGEPPSIGGMRGTTISGGGSIGGGGIGAPLGSLGRMNSRVKNALEHWKSHKSDFPTIPNATQYAKTAKSFCSNPPPGTLSKPKTVPSTNGDIFLYHPSSNTFAVKNFEGAPKTFFKPTDGLPYYFRQR